MCLIVFAYRIVPDYPMIMVANRDEFYSRPTREACYWHEESIIAGKDLKEGGTWLGLQHQHARFAAITNYREMDTDENAARSRGELPVRFLTSGETPRDFCQNLMMEKDQYRGFNFLAGNQDELVYCSNRHPEVQTLMPGLYGVSNGLLDTPWPKVVRAREALQQALDKGASSEALIEVLLDRTVATDEMLPDTGIGIEGERKLSPCFIQSDGYGTRSTTALKVAADQTTELTEQTWTEQGERYTQKYFLLHPA
jgi:uncharacterized protein with NRDE domain